MAILNLLTPKRSLFMLLCNTSDEVIKCQHGGMFTVFRPNEEKEIFDSYAAKHMLNRWGKNGLVDLTYGERETKQFNDYDEFKHQKYIEGTQKLVDHLQSVVLNFQLYDEACGDKKSVDRRHHAEQAKLVQKRLDAVMERLEKLLAGYGRKTPQQKAEALMKKAKELETKAKQLLKESSREHDSARPH